MLAGNEMIQRIEANRKRERSTTSNILNSYCINNISPNND